MAEIPNHVIKNEQKSWFLDAGKYITGPHFSDFRMEKFLIVKTILWSKMRFPDKGFFR